jgi:hypothetical protein
MLKHNEMFLLHIILTYVLNQLSDTIMSVTHGNLEITTPKTYTMINVI